MCKFTLLETNYDVIKEINALFIASDKEDKLKRKIIINDYPVAFHADDFGLVTCFFPTDIIDTNGRPCDELKGHLRGRLP